MNNLHILILEDEPDYALLIQKVLQKAGYRVSHADNLKDALGLYHSTRPDLVIVDIFLNGEKDGIVFANKINANEATRCPFIFLTSSLDRTVFNEAKLTVPYSFLLKPFNPLELTYAIDLAMEKFSGETGLLGQGKAITGKSCFFVKKNDSMIKIEPEDLDYITVEGRYCELWMGGEKFLIQSSLKDMMEQLAIATFIRIHRNHLVNFDRIKSISAANSNVILKDGTELQLSRRYMEEIKKNFPILM